MQIAIYNLRAKAYAVFHFADRVGETILYIQRAETLKMLFLLCHETLWIKKNAKGEDWRLYSFQGKFWRKKKHEEVSNRAIEFPVKNRKLLSSTSFPPCREGGQ